MPIDVLHLDHEDLADVVVAIHADDVRMVDVPDDVGFLPEDLLSLLLVLRDLESHYDASRRPPWG